MAGYTREMPVDAPDSVRFVEVFERTQDHLTLRAEIATCHQQLNADDALVTTKVVRKLRKAYAWPAPG